MLRSLAVFAVVLLSAVGCSSTAFLLNLGSWGGPQLQADGSVNEVMVVLQARLADADISVVTKSEDSQVRLVGITPAGKAFCLVLRPDHSARRKKTVIRVEGDAAGDEMLWRLVRAALERPPQNADSSGP
jgi:hypothetical protein